MKVKDVVVSLISIALITALGAWVYVSVSRPPANQCQVCNRGLHAGMTYRVEHSGGVESACCPRCGMHYQAEHPEAVRKALATDFESGRFVDAATAYYVEGGDDSHCTMGAAPSMRQPQGVLVRDFDRCLPSLVAFTHRQQAENYQKQHGGELIHYEQALERVKAQ